MVEQIEHIHAELHAGVRAEPALLMMEDPYSRNRAR